jgi:hypothetical protein
MKITKERLKGIIREEIQKVNEAVVEGWGSKKVTLKIPSFTVKAKLNAYEREGTGLISQPISVEIDSFDNNFEEQLNKIVPKAVADATNKAYRKEKVTEKGVYIGGSMVGVPKVFSFNKKN